MGKLMTKVLYNKECSVCNFEIEHYKKYTKQNSIDIEFEDLNNTNLKSWGVDKDQAERRMHAIFYYKTHLEKRCNRTQR